VRSHTDYLSVANSVPTSNYEISRKD